MFLTMYNMTIDNLYWPKINECFNLQMNAEMRRIINSLLILMYCNHDLRLFLDLHNITKENCKWLDTKWFGLIGLIAYTIYWVPAFVTFNQNCSHTSQMRCLAKEAGPKVLVVSNYILVNNTWRSSHCYPSLMPFQWEWMTIVKCNNSLIT